MPVVGVDFGTTNVRIAVRDSGEPGLTPRPLAIGQAGGFTMPSVIAFLRQPGGVATLVGEDADLMDDGPDTIVVRNIKRWALSCDPFVKWHLDAALSQRPHWWNEETRCVTAFGEDFPVWNVIRQILAEAFRRAELVGLDGEFEWRAGCPVQADWEYRSQLAKALSEFGGVDKASSIIEEPVLFLTPAHNLDTLLPGSYLVYDLGGGSFDCALVEVADGQMTVYASHGHPLLGGDRIDEKLAQSLDAPVSRSQLRITKERLSPSNPSEAILDDVSIHWAGLTALLDKDLFIEKTRAVMREAYISAKVIWKYDANAPTLGGSVIPSCRLRDMASAFAKDLDAIILTGGPTKSPFFRERLSEIFGAERVIDAETLIPPAALAPNMDPKLTGASLGACYAATEPSSPLYVRRLPFRISLRNTTSGIERAYEPYQHFTDRYDRKDRPIAKFDPERPFVSLPLPSQDDNSQYELTVTDVDGVVHHSAPVSFDHSRHGSRVALAAPSIVIDRFGRIGIQNGNSRWIEIANPSWQTSWQALLQGDELQEMQSRYDRRTWGVASPSAVPRSDWRDRSHRGIGGRVSD